MPAASPWRDSASAGALGKDRPQAETLTNSGISSVHSGPSAAADTTSARVETIAMPMPVVSTCCGAYRRSRNGFSWVAAIRPSGVEAEDQP